MYIALAHETFMTVLQNDRTVDSIHFIFYYATKYFFFIKNLTVQTHFASQNVKALVYIIVFISVFTTDVIIVTDANIKCHSVTRIISIKPIMYL